MIPKPISSHISRRRFLQSAACGFGSLALHAMLAEQAMAANDPMALRLPHHSPRAKRVIFLFMAGGPSQHDLFSNKPRLIRDHGQKPVVTRYENEITVGLEKSVTLGPVAK